MALGVISGTAVGRVGIGTGTFATALGGTFGTGTGTATGGSAVGALKAVCMELFCSLNETRTTLVPG